MVDRYAPLNERQLAVLRWIADGCPEGVVTGFSYKATALALQERRLVRVTKKRGGRRSPTRAGSTLSVGIIRSGRRPALPAGVGLLVCLVLLRY